MAEFARPRANGSCKTRHVGVPTSANDYPIIFLNYKSHHDELNNELLNIIGNKNQVYLSAD